MRKSILFSIAAAALVFGSGAFAFEEGKLTVWINGDKGYNGLAEVGKKFTKATGVAVEVAHPDKVEERFQQLASNASGPDIMFWAHDRFGEWVRGGLLSPLDPKPAIKSKIDDFAWNAVTINGKIYGYPVAVEAVALIYNKDLLPEPPKTFEEIPTLDTQLQKQGKNAILWAYETPYFAYPLLAANGGYAYKKRADGSYDVKDTGINNEGSKMGVQYLRDLIDKGHLPRGVDYGVAEAKFNKGEAALTINGPWSWDNLGKSGVKYGIAPLPTLNGKPAKAFVGVMAGAINNASPNKDLAVLFLEEYLLTVDGLKAVNSDKPLGAVAFKEYQRQLETDPRIAVTFKNAQNGEPMPSVPEMIKYWSSLQSALQNVASGRQGVKEALDAAAERILK